MLSASPNDGKVGGPSGCPVMCAYPLMASASVPNPGRWLFGPEWTWARPCAMRCRAPGRAREASDQSLRPPVGVGGAGGRIGSNAVGTRRCLRAHVAENHVTSYLFWIPLGGVPPSPAAAADQLDAR